MLVHFSGWIWIFRWGYDLDVDPWPFHTGRPEALGANLRDLAATAPLGCRTFAVKAGWGGVGWGGPDGVPQETIWPWVRSPHPQ